jgi:pimeloyl-ACP methyl ester carboxylesterase
MRIREYGKKHKDTIMLIHGGGLSWWNYREAAKLLEGEYHIVLPILDGHSGSDRPFTTIEENASEIISFIDEQLDGSALLIGGLSLGAQVLLEMLSQRRNLCSHALVESASVVPSKLTNVLIAPAFGSSYGLIKNRRFANLQFRSLHMRSDLFEDYYRDTCAIATGDMAAFLEANCAYGCKAGLAQTKAKVKILAGSREQKSILDSAKLLHSTIPGSCLEILPGLRHGDLSINHPERYGEILKEWVQSR